MPLVKDSDWHYSAVSIPWLSEDPVNVVLSTGRGFSNVFDDERLIEPDAQDALDMVGYEFVGLWHAEFPGVNMIAWAIFRRRDTSIDRSGQAQMPT